MGRRLLYPEKMEGTFREGTFAGIDDVLTEAEARTDFVRMAVEREIQSRQRRASGLPSPTRPGAGSRPNIECGD